MRQVNRYLFIAKEGAKSVSGTSVSATALASDEKRAIELATEAGMNVEDFNIELDCKDVKNQLRKPFAERFDWE